MVYSSVFDFFLEMLKNIHIRTNFLRSSDDLESFFSGFLQSLDKEKPIKPTTDFQEFCSQYHPKIIYRIQNFRFRFILFRLPGAGPTVYLAIGPYVLQDIPSLPQFSAPESAAKDIPLIDDEYQLLNMVATFIKRIFQEESNIPIQNLKFPVFSEFPSDTETLSLSSQDDPLLTIRMVEEYYDFENELMKLVSQGNWHKAEVFLPYFLGAQNFYRVYSGENTLNTQRIQSLDLNTLLRKSAESADVHPVHIENLYAHFALRIMKAGTVKEIQHLQREIVQKYCRLVQLHSLKGYSPIIQKVLIYIASNLPGDLSLNTQANLQNINPSYLSTLFKKETGTTLTEYVKQKRINHAVFLLTTTDLQIQAIAEICGISDVNYFTKIFKKIIGQTPKEFRDKHLQ